MALEGPSFFSFIRLVLSAATASITFGLDLYRKRLLLHEVIGPGIMVCVIFIIITFRYMHQIPFIYDDCLDLTLTHLTMVGEIDSVLASLYP
jgi:hypothetical protein